MNKWLLLLAVYLLAALLTALGAFSVAPSPDLADAYRPPGAEAWLGTDHLGRDLLRWSLQGARVAVVVGSVAAGIAVLLGTLLGVAAGWRGGAVDAAVLWLSGSVAAVPGIVLVLLLSYVIGGGYVGVFVAVGLASWVAIYRLVRAEVRRLRALPFVEALRAQGAGAPFLLRRHLLPHLGPLLLVQFSLQFLFAVKAEVVLSFLGVGMQDAPSWGLMMADAWAFDDLGHGRWWRLAAATLAMSGLVLAVQRVGDHLQRRWAIAPRP